MLASARNSRRSIRPRACSASAFTFAGSFSISLMLFFMTCLLTFSCFRSALVQSSCFLFALVFDLSSSPRRDGDAALMDPGSSGVAMPDLPRRGPKLSSTRSDAPAWSSMILQSVVSPTPSRRQAGATSVDSRRAPVSATPEPGRHPSGGARSETKGHIGAARRASLRPDVANDAFEADATDIGRSIPAPRAQADKADDQNKLPKHAREGDSGGPAKR